MPAKKKGPSVRQNQQRKLTMQQIAKGGPQKSGVKKPKPPAAPAKAASPRAITNGNSATMRQLRAKAVQANRQGQGKPVMGGTKGRATVLPNSARAGRNLIKEGAQRLRTIGDSGQVRAAQELGRKAVETAQRNRARVAAGVGKGAKELAALKGAAGVVGKAALPVAIAAQIADVKSGFEKLANHPFIKGRPKPTTPAAATPKGPTAAQRAALDSQEKKAREKLAARKAATKSSAATPNTAASFDDAFRDARRAKVKTFTWRGKKYTTEMK
jgi:hypothetical protein